MSAIGYFCSVEKIKGKDGEERVVILMNGKFLPYTEQVWRNLVRAYWFHSSETVFFFESECMIWVSILIVVFFSSSTSSCEVHIGTRTLSALQRKHAIANLAGVKAISKKFW